jgi:hypothetical protein
VQLGRRLRATTTSVDESLPRSRNVTFDSTADTQDSRSSPPSTPDENADPVTGDYKEPEVFGEISTGASFGTALESLKELESRDSSPAPAKRRTGRGSDIPIPAEALHVLEQATSHQEYAPDVERDMSNTDLRAHSEKQLINEQDKERRQSELDSFQEQSERSERNVLAEQAQPDNEESQSGMMAPADSLEQVAETPEPRLRRRRNFSASQKSLDGGEEAPADTPVQVNDGPTQDAAGATLADESSAPDAFVPDSIKADHIGNEDVAVDAAQGALGQDESMMPGTAQEALGPEESITPGAASEAVGEDESVAPSPVQKALEEDESITPGASILAGLAPVKADPDTIKAMEGATAAQEPSTTDTVVAAVLAGEAPSTESAEQVQMNNDAEPQAVEEAKAGQEEVTAPSKPDEVEDGKPVLTTAPDRNASHRKPGKLTAIERQIKEDAARVSSVTGKGRPGYEVPVKKQKGPRLPINLSLNLQVTIPKRAHKRLPATTTTSGDIGVNLSNKLTYNVQCLGLEISRSSPVGQLLTFGITAAIWVLWATGNW